MYIQPVNAITDDFGADFQALVTGELDGESLEIAPVTDREDRTRELRAASKTRREAAAKADRKGRAQALRDAAIEFLGAHRRCDAFFSYVCPDFQATYLVTGEELEILGELLERHSSDDVRAYWLETHESRELGLWKPR